ncbi:MAG: TraB/GumN family protein [Erythrobacter sp.]|nr:TraB/GumN family protein [Erythrobacter sp.]NCQ64279.1 TraB/GumN family protein [Alphaproteobacteria bacterium]
MTINKTLKTFASGCAIAALSLGAGACAQMQSTPTPVASTQVPASDVELGGPALWRVADDDTTIYVFGTVHALPEDIDWYTGPVKDALSESDELVTEVDMTPESMATIPAIVQKTAMLPAGTTVRSLMNGTERATYEGALTDLGMPVNSLDQLEPWFAALTLSQVAFQKAGFTGENGTETVLESIVGDTKGRDALETIEFQLSIFDGLPQDAQVEYLIETAQEIDGIAPMLQTMIDEWAAGDVDDLGELLNEALEADPALANRLLYARNANWASWIDERLDQPGTVFMAVGAGHLAGNQSLQDKLAERGISITRIQ